MSGAARSMAGAAAFQMSSTSHCGPPLATPVGSGTLEGPASEALTYIGSGFTALPALATALTKLATYQVLNARGACLPKACSHVPDLPVAAANAAGICCEKSRLPSAE